MNDGNGKISARGLLMSRVMTLSLLFGLMMMGCTPEPYSVNVGFANGSTSGPHGVTKMIITTVSGGRANFAMGAVGSPIGALSSGGANGSPRAH